MPCISVIVPVYNSEKSLSKCIESIRRQTFDDIEIILINDGSTDRSSEICSAFAAKDSRIRLINQKNSGADKARQSGINMSTGHYLTFVDSDDFIEPDMLSQIYLTAVQSNADIVQCNYWEVHPNKKNSKLGVRSSIELSVSGRENCVRVFVEQLHVTNFLWDKIFRREIFNSIEHTGFSTGEDVCLLVQLFGHCEKVVLIDKPFYHYVLTDSSLTRAQFNLKQLDSVYAGVFVYDYCTQNFPSLIDYSRLTICSYAARYYCKLRRTGLSAAKEQEMHEIFHQYYIERNPAMSAASVKRRILIKLFKFSPYLCCKLLSDYS